MVRSPAPEPFEAGQTAGAGASAPRFGAKPIVPLGMGLLIVTVVLYRRGAPVHSDAGGGAVHM